MMGVGGSGARTSRLTAKVSRDLEVFSEEDDFRELIVVMLGDSDLILVSGFSCVSVSEFIRHSVSWMQYYVVWSVQSKSVGVRV